MRIAIIGNCQVQTYALLASAMFSEAEIRTVDYSQAETRDESYRREFVEENETFDIVLAQTALLSHTGEHDLRQRYPGKVLTIANFYFRGLFPDSCYIGGFRDRLVEPSSVHSLIVLDAFMRQLSAEQAARQFTIENGARLGILNAWPASMEELRRREAHGAIDIPGADLVEDACRRYPAFLTMNHPSLSFLSEYFHRVCRQAGLPFRYANPSNLQDPLAHHDTTPVYDEVAEHLGLPYRTTQRWKLNRLDARYLTREEYVAACYAVYENSDLATLIVNSPTDMVQRLRTNAPLKHLVSGEGLQPASSEVLGEDHREILSRKIESLSEISGRLHEIVRVSHRLHSYLEVMDPKVESIFYLSSKPPEPPRQTLSDRLAAAIRLWPVLAACFVVVLLGMSAIAIVVAF